MTNLRSGADSFCLVQIITYLSRDTVLFSRLHAGLLGLGRFF